MIWRDITHYDSGEEGGWTKTHGPLKFMYEVGDYEILLHRRFSYEGWYISCKELDLDRAFVALELKAAQISAGEVIISVIGDKIDGLNYIIYRIANDK